MIFSLLYGPTLTSIHEHWKTTDLTIQTSISKVMSLLFNPPSKFVIAFLPRSKVGGGKFQADMPARLRVWDPGRWRPCYQPYRRRRKAGVWVERGGKHEKRSLCMSPSTCGGLARRRDRASSLVLWLSVSVHVMEEFALVQVNVTHSEF